MMMNRYHLVIVTWKVNQNQAEQNALLLWSNGTSDALIPPKLRIVHSLRTNCSAIFVILQSNERLSSQVQAQETQIQQKAQSGKGSAHLEQPSSGDCFSFWVCWASSVPSVPIGMPRCVCADPVRLSAINLSRSNIGAGLEPSHLQTQQEPSI